MERKEHLMSSSIGGIGGSSAIHLREMRAMKRPDPAQMADALFSKLDSAKQGYIEKSDLQGAIAKVVSSSSARSSAAAATSDSASLANELFSKLDSNSDGKVTKQEFSDTLKKIGEQLDSQLMHARTTGAMAQGGANGTQAMNGPPPPRPPEGAGLTKEQLSSVASKMETSNSDLSSKLTALVTNFDQADTNGDGKISFQEAQAYQEAKRCRQVFRVGIVGGEQRREQRRHPLRRPSGVTNRAPDGCLRQRQWRPRRCICRVGQRLSLVRPA
jgi:EF hand.